jgi:26S proteasome regulatory subunit N1
MSFVFKCKNSGPGVGGVSVDSAKQNLASTFVNAFVNAGFGQDKLMAIDGENTWIYKNKDHGNSMPMLEYPQPLGMMSAAASLGAIMLWDVEGGLGRIDKYLYSTDNNIQVWFQV